MTIRRGPVARDYRLPPFQLRQGEFEDARVGDPYVLAFPLAHEVAGHAQQRGEPGLGLAKLLTCRAKGGAAHLARQYVTLE